MVSIFQCTIINIPDLLKNPYIIQPVSLGGELYFFEYKWNIRYGRAFLSIFKKENGTQKYFVKNICLIPQLSISDNIHDTNWSGLLTFGNQIGGSNAVDYRQDTINIDFDIKYFAEEE